MKKRQARLQRIKSVEQEYFAAEIAAALLAERLHSDPSSLPSTLRARDGEAVRRNLEATFLIRIFAEFEAGLRDYWRDGLHRKKRPGTEVLIDRVADARHIPSTTLAPAHEVHLYRNSLVHEGNGKADPVSLEIARSRLCKFFSFLPIDW